MLLSAPHASSRVVGQRWGWAPTLRCCVLIASSALLLQLAATPAEAVTLLLAVGATLSLLAGGEALLLTWAVQRIQLTRRHPTRMMMGRAYSIQLELDYHGALPLLGQLVDDGSTGSGSPTAELPLHLLPGRTTSVHYHIVPTRRGEHRFTAVWLRLSTPIGLTALRVRFAAQTQADIVIDLDLATRYHLATRPPLRARGGRQLWRERGGGSDIERLREYVSGDLYRDIDWMATARRDRPIVRVRQHERHQRVLLAIDRGHTMAQRIGREPRFHQQLTTELPSRFELACSSAALLAQAANRQQDRVGLCLFDDSNYDYLPPARGVRSLALIRSRLEHADALLRCNDLRGWARWLTSRLTRRALIVLWTDLGNEPQAAELEAAVALLQRRHVVLIVTPRDPDLERLAMAGAGDRQQLYLRAVAAGLLARRAMLARKLSRAATQVLEVSSAAMALAVVERYLEIKRRGVL